MNRMHIIKAHASLIARIAAVVTVAGFIAVMLFTQPVFHPANPIYAGQAPEAETMITSQEADDIDTDSVSEKPNKSDEKKNKDKKEEKKEDRKNDKDKDSKSGEKEDKNKEKDKNVSDRDDQGENSKAGRVKEDPNSDKGNKSGMADRNDPINEEGPGNNGRETPNPMVDPVDSPKIVTDLSEYDNPRIITFKELRSGKLEFFAYIANIEKNMDLRVKYVNDSTGRAGKYLVADGRNYELKLAEGRNKITLYMRKKSTAIYSVTYTIDYLPAKADRDDPAVGEHPPRITAYGTSGLDNFEKHIKIPNYIFRVQAETYKGNYLPYDNMQVKFIPEVGNSRILDIPTGNGLYEYDIYFIPPVSGDEYKAKVEVTAWDKEGNSSFKEYELTYEQVGDDVVIGVCEVFVDMTTIGFGVDYAGFEYEVHRGDKASECVLAALDHYGLTPTYDGTVDDRFYLRGVSSGMLTYGARIPPLLYDLLDMDGLEPGRDTTRDDLFEFDFSQGSGWMYTIDGVNYPGRGMDKYELTGDETITLRFTLAIGKDLGITNSAKGNLSRYCGSWYNGEYHPRHVFDDGGGSVVSGDGCEEETVIRCWHCSICNKYFMSEDHKSVPLGYEDQVQDGSTVKLPPGEHRWEIIRTVDPTAEEEGYTEYECSVCGKTKKEIIAGPEPVPENEGSDSGDGERP